MMFFEKLYETQATILGFLVSHNFWFLQLSISTQNLLQSFDKDPKLYQPMSKVKAAREPIKRENSFAEQISG